MNFLTDTSFFSPRLLPSPSRQSSRLPPLPRRPRPDYFAPARFVPMLPAEDRVSQGMLIGLLTVTLPATVYGLLQVWQLVGAGTLHHAVRAFLP